ncbi:putative ribonuclease H-like domain-containing protein [Tanacetum coccineum]
MEELLRAPTEGYGEAIVLPEINADHFEIKTNLLQLVQAKPFRMNTTSRESVSKLMRRIDKLADLTADQLSTLVEIVSKKVATPAPVKAVEESYVTCDGAHSWYNCPATDNNQIAPTILLPKKVVERGTEETRIKSKQNSKDIVYQLNSTCGYPHFYSGTELLRLCLNPLHSEIDIRKESNLSQNISYPSRRDDQKSRDKASIKWRRSSQIFLDLRFETLVSRLNTIELALLGNASQKASRKAWQIPASAIHPKSEPFNSNSFGRNRCYILMMIRFSPENWYHDDFNPEEIFLKDLPSYLEYADLEENNKLPVIIAKGLKNDEKDALLKVLKSHKGAIAWKITDIKGIDPRFCTHKILMEDDYKHMAQVKEQGTPFVFSKDCIDAFQTLKKKLIEAPILVVPDWNLPFELMCDASDFAIGAVLGHEEFILLAGFTTDVVSLLKKAHSKIKIMERLITLLHLAGSQPMLQPSKRCGYSKNLKKTVKTGQTRTRERKSTQRAGKMLYKSKADEGFFVGYSLNSKAFRVFNSRTKIVEENLHIRFSESTPNVVGSGPDWLFDIDALTRTMNYKPIVAGTQSNGFAGTKASDNAGQARKETEPVKNYILLPLWPADPPFSQDPKSSQDDGSKPSSDDEKKVDEDPRKDSESIDQEKDDNVNSTNNVNAASTNEVNVVGGKTSIELPDDPNMPALEDISIFDLSRDNEDVGAEADMNNLDTTIQVSPIPTTRIHKDHPLNQVIRDLQSATQTRNMSKNLEEHGFVSTIQQRTNHKDLQNCLFACFLSQEEPKKVIHALKDPSWIEAMQEELLQFKLQEVWTLVDLPNGKGAIGTKWVFKNKKDEMGIVIRNKARLVTQGYTQEERIDYDEVFAHVARIEAISLFLAYASFKDFVVYQMDVKNTFLYGKIEKEVYVCQPPGFEDPDFPDKVYKVEKALYGLHQAPRAWYETLSTYLLDNEFQRGKIDKTLFTKRYKGDILLMSSMGELTFFLGLQVQQKKDDVFISQDKYVGEILKKFGFTEVKTASTPIETQKPLLKDEDSEEVDVRMYRSMIGLLMYIASSRPDIMFIMCACARYQVNLKVSHLHAVKRIFRYLKGQLKLGLWYPKDSLFDLVAYTNSDYARAILDRKSTTGGCQFLGCRLI